jgi:carbonic anhydrase
MDAPIEILSQLKQGNARYAAGQSDHTELINPARRSKLVAGQAPLAVIVGCADSRVPAEIVFDQGLGDLFVIRVAGNVVAPSQIGSVEYAAEHCGTRLVIVLGHSSCGAVQATLGELQQPTEGGSPNIKSIIKRISPAVAPLLATDLKNDEIALMQAAVKANVQASANQLRNGSAILEQLIKNQGLLVVGAEYDLATGIVDFFDGMPKG